LTTTIYCDLLLPVVVAHLTAGPSGAGTAAVSSGVRVRALVGRVGPTSRGTPGGHPPCPAREAVARTERCRQAATEFCAEGAVMIEAQQNLTHGSKKLDWVVLCVHHHPAALAKTYQRRQACRGQRPAGMDGCSSPHGRTFGCRNGGGELRRARTRARRPGRAHIKGYPRRPDTVTG
jgi:hypothetical protein